MVNPSRPLRAAKQSRSQSTVDAIREATLLIIEKQGPDALTTNKIAELAGVGIASLYRYYPNKEAILTDLYERELLGINEMLADLAESDLDDEFEAQILEAIEISVNYNRRLLKLNSNFFRTFRKDFDITCRSNTNKEFIWSEQAMHWLLELICRNTERLRIDNPRRAAQITYDLVTGYISHLVEYRPDELENPDLPRDLTEIVCRYLISDS